MTWKQFAVAGGGVLFGTAVQVASPELTRDQKVALWLLVAIYFIVFGLYEIRSRRWRLGMTWVSLVLLGAALGAIAGGAIYAFFPLPKVESKPDDGTALLISKSDPEVTVVMSPLIPDPNLLPADPNDLELYFFALMGAAGKDNIQYADVTITNRSPRKMHLEIWGEVDYWKDSGEPARTGLKAEWNPMELMEGTGQRFIDLNEWETVKGRIAIFLGKPGDGVNRWFLEAGENIYFEVFDSVTGKRIAFKAMEGYPSGQMPSPLPSHKKLLALEFPKGHKIDSFDDPPDALLELLFRTRDLGFNDARMHISAMLRNNSSDRMELCVNLLGRSAQDENTWLSLEGSWSRNGAPAERLLSIESDQLAEATLHFDLAVAGMDSANQQLSRLPKDTLFEVADRISGKKIWCAVLPGYPPGTDMRGFTILPPVAEPAKPSLENPQPNVSNPPKDESKDTK